MKRTIPHNTIRFRRWARKEYAIFRSLGCCVTIGTLRQNVVDASLKKQKVGIRVNPFRMVKNGACDDEPDDGLSYDLLLRSELTGQLPLVGETGCPDCNYINTKPNNCSREDIHISLRLIYFK